VLFSYYIIKRRFSTCSCATADHIKHTWCFSPIPRIDFEQYDLVILVMGGTHNLLCGILLMTYFLSNHPTLPSITGMMKSVRWANCIVLLHNQMPQC